MTLAFGAEVGGVKIGEPIYGVFWRRTNEIHRTAMTWDEAVEWIEECKEVFPRALNVWEIFGVCTASWSDTGLNGMTSSWD